MENKLSFIGCGNIASAMIRGIIKAETVKPEQVIASDVDAARLDSITKETGVQVTADNSKAVDFADIIFICVEPKHASEIANQIKEQVKNDKIIVSVAAGVGLSDLTAWYLPDTKIVRIMPNLPMTVGEGMSMICESDLISDEEMHTIITLTEAFGKVEVMDEKYMNAFVATASSSPAIVFVMIEAMADAAVSMGITRKKAYNIAAQAVLGAAKMVVETQQHPGVLKDMVTSPAGTTIEAIASLEETGFRHSLIHALRIAEEKCNKIKK